MSTESTNPDEKVAKQKLQLFGLGTFFVSVLAGLLVLTFFDDSGKYSSALDRISAALLLPPLEGLFFLVVFPPSALIVVGGCLLIRSGFRFPTSKSRRAKIGFCLLGMWWVALTWIDTHMSWH